MGQLPSVSGLFLASRLLLLATRPKWPSRTPPKTPRGDGTSSLRAHPAPVPDRPPEGPWLLPRSVREAGRDRSRLCHRRSPVPEHGPYPSCLSMCREKQWAGRYPVARWSARSPICVTEQASPKWRCWGRTGMVHAVGICALASSWPTCRSAPERSPWFPPI